MYLTHIVHICDTISLKKVDTLNSRGIKFLNHVKKDVVEKTSGKEQVD